MKSPSAPPGEVPSVPAEAILCPRQGRNLSETPPERACILHNSGKLPQGRFRSHIEKYFFLGKVVKHWHGLPRAVGGSLSLEVLENLWMWHLSR